MGTGRDGLPCAALLRGRLTGPCGTRAGSPSNTTRQGRAERLSCRDDHELQVTPDVRAPFNLWSLACQATVFVDSHHLSCAISAKAPAGARNFPS
jgi:hypothetical protein